MKRPRLLISCAWLLHAAAWFLPVVNGGVTLPKGCRGGKPSAMPSPPCDPFQGTKSETWYYAVLATVSAATTLLFIFGSPSIMLRGSRSLWRASAWVAATAFVNAHGMFSRGLIGQTSGFGTSSRVFLLPGWR